MADHGAPRLWRQVHHDPLQQRPQAGEVTARVGAARLEFSGSLRDRSHMVAGLEVQDITLFAANKLKRVKARRRETSPTPREAKT